MLWISLDGVTHVIAADFGKCEVPEDTVRGIVLQPAEGFLTGVAVEMR